MKKSKFVPIKFYKTFWSQFSLLTIIAIFITLALANVGINKGTLKAEAAGTPIVINHDNATKADLANIPTTWINAAKADLHIAYQHTSHGSQIIDGMTGLTTFAGAPIAGSNYAFNDGGTGGALDIDDYFSSGDLGAPDFTTWAGLTRTYLDANTDVNVVMWSWCGQVSGASVDNINTYLAEMNHLETDYPNVKFVYMTGHTDGSGLSGNLHLRNQQIRDYVTANGKILYDFEDIESYNPDGDYFGDHGVTDSCGYDTGNWATEWQNSHTQGVDWYSCTSAHSEPVNANMKAYAAWSLWAKLAGWDGTTEAPGPLHHINISPSTAQTITSGQSIQFTAQGQDVDNRNIPSLVYSWTGTSASGLFTNTTTGTHIVRVSSSGTDSQSVSVTVNAYVPPAIWQNVYRFYNMRNGSHFFTASEAEKNNVIARYSSTYRYEGVNYTINTNSQKNMVPLYRLYNTKGSHFYTSSYEEAMNAVRRWPKTYRFEGVAYNVTLDSNGTSPVYRFYNMKIGTHFYTANLAERNNVIARWPSTYRYEGISYYLPN